MAEDVGTPVATREVESRFRNQGSAIVGTEPRFCEVDPSSAKKGITIRKLNTRSVNGSSVPRGPSYNASTSGLGRQVDSRHRSEGRTVISATDPRFLLYGDSSTKVQLKRHAPSQQDERKQPDPAPTRTPSSLGRQTLSTMRSAGSFSFGASQRTKFKHPTPNAELRDVSQAKDKLSSSRSAPKHSFGVGSRFQRNRLFGEVVDRSPGPCGYDADTAYKKTAAGSVLTPKWATGKKPEPRDKSGRTSTRSIYRF